MISQEFLDEFNKSELGKALRLKYFKCSEETLSEINRRLNKTYTHDILNKLLKTPGQISKLTPILEFIKENNEFVFDMDNIKGLKDSSIELMSFYFSNEKFPEIDETFCEFVKETGVKRLYVTMINNTFSMDHIEDLPIEELRIEYGEAEGIDLSKFHSMKKIEMRNVTLTNLSSLNIPEDIESLLIYIDKDNPCTSLKDIKRFKNLKELNLNGALPHDSELIKIITTLSSLESLNISLKDEEKDKSEFDMLFENPSELEISNEDLPGFLNLSNLKKISGFNIENLEKYLSYPKVTSLDELRKVSFLDYFNSMKRRKIYYSSKEPIDPKVLERLEDVELIASSPLVFDENFIQNYHRSPDIKIRFDHDSLENYEISEISAINDVMQQILGGIPKEASDFEKVAYIYKKIGEMAYYDRTGCIGDESYVEGRNNIVRSLKGGLIENKLVCVGYSLVLKKFLDELGIESRIISGDVPGIPNSGHEWNQVKIDGKWYNVDLTWDAKTIRSGGKLEYFLLNDEEFYKTHRVKKVNTSLIDYISPDKNKFIEFIINQYNSKIEPFKCDESYDKEKIAEYFGYSVTPQTSQEMIEDASNVPLTIEEIRKEASTIVDTQRAAVQIQNQEIGEVVDE